MTEDGFAVVDDQRRDRTTGTRLGSDNQLAIPLTDHPS
ncbi:hypothetical protein FHR36_007442 [Kitasatospora paracochleata]|uniref:Uncharacterized protein n=1 Tax=Kitasatospora paracochleata TaxID=58354 RepID=A0ABT1J9W6_9ACTN|nr:hypothetical protein [Kitasatospora paracochleata]